jgi:hypothetical protein
VRFNVDNAEILNCTPYIVKKLTVEFEECGNGWFRKGDQDGTTSTANPSNP